MKKLLLSLFLVFVFAAGAAAQGRTITGTVTDSEDGSPILVSIRIRGVQGGTQTGGDGKYSIA